MRSLGLQDVFIISEIIDLMDIRLDLNALIQETRNQSDDVSTQIEFAGAQITMTLIRSLHKAEHKVYGWIASMKDISTSEAKNMSLKELKAFVTEIMKDEDFSDFLSLLGEKTEPISNSSPSDDLAA